MSNKEKYQRTFSTLHASDEFLTEVHEMNKARRFSGRKLVCACVAAVLVFGMATVAYADDVGGIRRTVQLWIHGEQTDVVWEVENGKYTASWEDAYGEHTVYGGGVAFDDDGTERPATEEELLEHMERPIVNYNDDGTVFVYYHSQSIEITDRFDDNGICFMLLKDGSDELYMTIKYQNGYARSPNSYVQPWEFN